jgi:hypothetical protein
VLSGSHLPTEKALSVLHHIAEGDGVRETGRLVGVNRGTVARYGRKAGAHAADVPDELVAVSPSDPSGPTRREVGLRLAALGVIGTTRRASEVGHEAESDRHHYTRHGIKASAPAQSARRVPLHDLTRQSQVAIIPTD